MLLPASQWDWVSLLSVLSWQRSLEPADAVISPAAVGSNAVTKNIYLLRTVLHICLGFQVLSECHEPHKKPYSSVSCACCLSKFA